MKSKSKIEKKSFIKGFLSSFNLKGDTFEMPKIETNDAENIKSYWVAVGNDIRKSMDKQKNAQ